MVQELQDQVRFHINRFVFDNGYAPTSLYLAQQLNVGEEIINNELKKLADNHALVLHPNSFKIWVAHPFALFPTLFWVKCADKTWWGNCVWCSLGIASLTKANTSIFTRIKGEEESIQIDIVDGQVSQKDLVVHYPVPAKKLWDNVMYTCSTMLVFKNESDVDNWCSQHNVKKGEVHSIETAWKLAQLWYGNYLDPKWTRKTPEYAGSLFTKAGLTGDFWKVK